MKSAFGHYTVWYSSVTDGLSNTVFLGEILQGERFDIRGLIWSSIPGGGTFFSRLSPNKLVDFYQTGGVGDQLSQPIFCVNEPGVGLPCTGGAGDLEAYTGTRSRHPGGLNVLMGDGSVRFLKDTTNAVVWLALNTIAEGEVIAADQY
jgi:prepilin-type processing-associated H-X9-DG protein